MKFFKKVTALLLAACLAFSFVGCTYQDKEVIFSFGKDKKNVFTIGQMQCTVKEARVYLMTSKNIYGVVDGTNLWTEDFDTSVITSSLKDLCMNHLIKVYALNFYAQENEITLEEEDIEACDLAAEAYYGSLSSEERKYIGASKKDISQMYQRYALAEKISSSLINSVDDEVSEDEARVMHAFVLFVETPEDAAIMQEKIDYGYTFERIASTYTTLDSYKETFGRGEYPEVVDDVVFNLDTKEISHAIEADGGYYFFQCINKYDEELSEANKSVIVEKRKQQVFDDLIASIESTYFSTLNTEVWDELGLDNPNELNNGEFFKTLDSYISF